MKDRKGLTLKMPSSNLKAFLCYFHLTSTSPLMMTENQGFLSPVLAQPQEVGLRRLFLIILISPQQVMPQSPQDT